MKIDIDDIIKRFTGQKASDPQREHHKANFLARFHISRRLLVALIVVVASTVIITSAAVLLGERGNEPETSAPESSSLFQADPEQINTGLLLALTQNSKENLDFLAHMSVNTETGEVTIRSLDTHIYANAAGSRETIEKHFNNGGITQLQEAVIDAEGIAVARYIVCSEENFTYILQLINPIELNVEQSVQFDYNGISLTIDAGQHTFTPDEAMKYFRFLCSDCERNAEDIQNVLRQIAANFYDENNAEKLETLYSEIVNLITTDISALDIANYAGAINAMGKENSANRIKFEPLHPFFKDEAEN